MRAAGYIWCTQTTLTNLSRVKHFTLLLASAVAFSSCSKSGTSDPDPAPAKNHTVTVRTTARDLHTQVGANGQQGAEMGATIGYYFDGVQKKEDYISSASPSFQSQGVVFLSPSFGNSAREFRLDLDFKGILRSSTVPVSNDASLSVEVTVDGKPVPNSPFLLNKTSPYRASGNMGTSTTIDLTKF